jgi:surface antigen
LAEVANLPVAANTANISASLAIKHEIAQASETTLQKPQIIATTLSHGISVYKVVDGDTLESIATANKLSTQTLRWANGLKDDGISVGQDLVVPSVDGVVYTVKDGDSIESLASKYKSNVERVITVNDLELDGLKVGEKIILPDGELPETERPDYVAPIIRQSAGSYTAPNPLLAVSAGNRYAYGNCTWYAYERRVQLGRPIGSYWGNATSWYASAKAAGYSVGSEPMVGAIQQNFGYLGHVSIVESVDHAAGTVTISEMNGVAGWNRIGHRTMSMAEARGYNYIY